jgi:hypothetical protein
MISEVFPIRRSPTTTVFCPDSMLDVNMDSISGLGQNTSPFTTHPYSKGFMAFSPWRGQFIKVLSYYQV